MNGYTSFDFIKSNLHFIESVKLTINYTMKKLLLALFAIAGITSAHAQVTGNLGLATDYRFRGISRGRRSQDRRAVVQCRCHREQADCPGQRGGPGCGLDHLSGSRSDASGRQ